MLNKIKNLNRELDIININSASELEFFRIKFLGKKGILNSLFKELKKKQIDDNEKRNIGYSLNILKIKIKNLIKKKKKKLKIDSLEIDDLTKPGKKKFRI